MAVRTQDTSAYYVWQVPGKQVSVQLRLEVVDHLSAEVVRGLGANPKRGAEVGGILLGTVEQGPNSTVRVEEFQLVPCEYRRGPSYAFTEKDGEAFERAWMCWQPAISPKSYAVGYFRSHTRDGLELTEDDLALLDQFFPDPAYVALLIKPFATKPGIASFFFREDGVFQEKSLLEFPFRRYELTGEDPPPRRPLMDRERPPDRPAPVLVPVPPPEVPAIREAPAVREPAAYSEHVEFPPRAQKQRGWGWIWIWMPLLLVLLGIVLGYEAGSGPRPHLFSNPSPNLSLSLSATRNGDNLKITWNVDSPAVMSAQRGILDIQENGRIRSLELDGAQLRNGALIYRNSSNSVRFRLTVYPGDRLTLSEIAEWKE